MPWNAQDACYTTAEAIPDYACHNNSVKISSSYCEVRPACLSVHVRTQLLDSIKPSLGVLHLLFSRD